MTINYHYLQYIVYNVKGSNISISFTNILVNLINTIVKKNDKVPVQTNIYLKSKVRVLENSSEFWAVKTKLILCVYCYSLDMQNTCTCSL